MTPPRAEQRNPYQGSPARPAVDVGLTAIDGSRIKVRLLADTGNPFAIIIGETTMERLRRRAASDVDTNFGILKGFWLRLNMPELGLEQELLAYASDAVAEAAETSDRAFEGLAGLPFLRLLEFGGDADSFWLRATTH